QFLRLVEQHRLLSHALSYRYVGSVRIEEELLRVEQDLFNGLGQITELFYDGRPLTVDATPWTPTLRLGDHTTEDGLALSWSDQPLIWFEVGGGHVIDTADRLRPLDPRVPAWATGLFDQAPPPVPAAEIGPFVDEFLTRAPLPIEVHSTRLALRGGLPTPRLLLGMDGARLTTELRFAYGGTEVAAEGPPVVAAAFADERVLLRRDAEAEAALAAMLAAALPEGPLEGDAAHDFLLDGLPQLAGWEITVDRALDLNRLRPIGTATVATQLRAGIDWFDLQVDFSVEGRSVSRAAVLQTWREGRRYVRLDSGELARLPDAWLARHGDALAELEDLRTSKRAKFGTFAAPLAAELLDELPADEAVQRWREMAERVRAFERVPEREVPAALNAELRSYQHRGFRWLAALRDVGLGAVLADDMGLGKTLQALALLLDSHGAKKKGPPSLVVAPTSVVFNWMSEAARFAPTLRFALHHGPRRGDPPTDVDVVVTSYALLRIDAEKLAEQPWRHVVLDEAQNIKNPASHVARAARGLDAEHRVVLTGTPLENHLGELWSLFHFLMPGFFGSRRAFQQRYAGPASSGDAKVRSRALEALRRRIRPFVLRRLKAEVASELPPRQEQVLYCRLGPAERRLYEAVKQTYRDTVLGEVDQKGVAGSTIRILEALTRLRQACCDPQLVPFPEAQAITASAKRALLRETLAEIIDEGHRALVFSQWPSLLKRVIPDLDAIGARYLYLDGSTTERGALQAQWNAPGGPPVFLISLKAGGTGLNLTGADHVFHLDPWWNPAAEAQATDRAHRIGQTRPVMVYKLVARDTVEEKIIELQARKRALFEAAVDGDRLTVDTLTRADLEAVFADDADALADTDEVGGLDADEANDSAEIEAPPPRSRKRKARK
ncbi:MAG: SNF2 helicase associated domain-containing protein, partial [Myxococcales bacterium]|nr:SNF2 helicase associated domain-containing protein [Myxococcales bacterium]